MKHLYIILFVLPLIGFGQTHNYVKEYSKYVGTLISEGNLIDDKKDGLWKYYFEDGTTIRSEENYVFGKLISKTTYHVNGRVKEQYKIIRECWDKDGTKIDCE